MTSQSYSSPSVFRPPEASPATSSSSSPHRGTAGANQPSASSRSSRNYHGSSSPPVSNHNNSNNNSSSSRIISKQKSGTLFKVGLCVAVTVVVGGLVAFLVFFYLRKGDKGNNDANSAASSVYFEGIGMGFLQMEYYDSKKRLCVTHFESGQESDFLLMDCAPKDAMWLLEQQAFYYRPDRQQIVSNANGQCVTFTPQDQGVLALRGWLQLEPCRGEEEEEEDSNGKSLAEQQWYPDDQGRVRHANKPSMCWFVASDAYYGDLILKLGSCASTDRQIVQVPEQFWAPPKPTVYAQPILPNMTGAFQSVTGRDECITFWNKTQELGLEHCHFGDNQLFRFHEETLQWELSSGEGCLARRGRNESGVEIVECLRRMVEVASSNHTTIINTTDVTTNDTSTYLLDMDTLEDVVASERNGGASNLLTGNDTSTNLSLSEGHERQQWYYDREGRLYNYPEGAATSFCLGMNSLSSAKNNVSRRRRYLKRMSGGGGGSSSSGGGGSSSSGGSRPTGSVSRPYLGSSGSSGPSSSSSSGSFTSSTVSAGSSRNYASTEGYPSSFMSNSGTGAFRPSHPSYASRPADSYYVARNRLYFARANRLGRRPSDQPTPSPEVDPSSLHMDECRSQFASDIGYDDQRFSFIPRSGVFRNGNGSIKLGTSNHCLTVTDEWFSGNYRQFIVRPEPCTYNSNQYFKYATETGQLEGTGPWQGKCLLTSNNIDSVYMSECSYIEYMNWRQDSQGRLVNEKNSDCLDWDIFGSKVTRKPCQDGASQMVFWEAAQQSSDAPSIVPSSAPSSGPSTSEGAAPTTNTQTESNSPTLSQTTASSLDGSAAYEIGSTNYPSLTPLQGITPRPRTRAPTEAPVMTLGPIPAGNIFGRPLPTTAAETTTSAPIEVVVPGSTINLSKDSSRNGE